MEGAHADWFISRVFTLSRKRGDIGFLDKRT